MFIEHGTQKLFDYPLRSGGGAGSEILSLPWLAAVIEVAGGALTFAGFMTCPVVFILSGEMAFAYFMVHATKSPFAALNRVAAAILFCFLILDLVFSGPGAWSIDETLNRKI